MPAGNDLTRRVRRAVESSISVKQRLLEDDGLMATAARVSEILIDVFQAGNKPLLFGNGGSAADAQHIAAEFVGRFGFNRPALPALALSVNSSCVTAIGNDYGYENVFARQIEALGRPGDAAIGISTSGNSENLLRAFETAKRIGMHTIGLTGESGGRVKSAVDHCIRVPSNETPRIQECHILIGHIMAELVEQALFVEQSCALTS